VAALCQSRYSNRSLFLLHEFIIQNHSQTGLTMNGFARASTTTQIPEVAQKPVGTVKKYHIILIIVAFLLRFASLRYA